MRIGQLIVVIVLLYLIFGKTERLAKLGKDVVDAIKTVKNELSK